MNQAHLREETFDYDIKKSSLTDPVLSFPSTRPLSVTGGKSVVVEATLESSQMKAPVEKQWNLGDVSSGEVKQLRFERKNLPSGQYTISYDLYQSCSIIGGELLGREISAVCDNDQTVERTFVVGSGGGS